MIKSTVATECKISSARSENPLAAGDEEEEGRRCKKEKFRHYKDPKCTILYHQVFPCPSLSSSSLGCSLPQVAQSSTCPSEYLPVLDN